MIRIILQKDVLNLGDAGDIKDVNDGYARNYLFPQRLAVRADKGNTKNALHNKKMIELRKEKRSKEMKELSASLNGKSVEIKVSVGENDKLYGAVTPMDIAAVLKKDGFSIDKRKIELSDNIKAIGAYTAKVKLAEGIHSSINVNVVKAD